MIARRIAWGAWSLCALLTIVALLLAVLNERADDLQIDLAAVFANGIGFMAFPTVGAFIASRRPDNRIGWIFIAIGLCTQTLGLIEQYVTYGLATEPGSLPGPRYVALLGVLYAPPVAMVVVFVPLLFPGGHLLSRRWRFAGWLAALFVVSAMIYNLFRPGIIESGPLSFPNPIGLKIAEPLLESLAVVGVAGLAIAIVASIISLVIRWKRAGGIERQQLKWILFASIVCGVMIFISDAIVTSVWLTTLAFNLVPSAAGLAILRYRLYDIDVIINRALVYAVLTGILGAAYVAATVIFQRAFDSFTRGSGLAVAGSTLAVAALFRPVRARVQAFIDYRFYRRKYDAEKTLDTFSARLRDKIDIDAMRGELLGTVRETMQPQHVTLWLKAPSAHAEAPRLEKRRTLLAGEESTRST